MKEKDGPHPKSHQQCGNDAVRQGVVVQQLSDSVSPVPEANDDALERERSQRTTVPQLTSERIDALIGKLIDGRFSVLSVIGSGGMSVVYKARHEAMDKIVALKILHPRLISDQATLMRFQQEAKAASRISHSNIIAVHDFGMTEDGMPYLVMDYVEGQTLADIIAEQGPFSFDRASSTFKEICSALNEAHMHGVVHRDLKPGNIMLVKSAQGETVKVLDFGIAKILTSEGEQHLTQTGDIFGSPLYMSPEQCMGKKLDQRSDIYSMGCLMYEVLTGRPPLVGATAFETIHKQINDMPERIASMRKDLSRADDMHAIILKAMAKDPAQRYQSMHELDQALARVSNDGGWLIFKRVSTVLQLLRLNWSHLEQQGIRKRLFLAALLIVSLAVAAWLASILLSPVAEPKEDSVEQLWFKDSHDASQPLAPDRLTKLLEGVRVMRLTEHHMLTLPTPTNVVLDMQLRVANSLFHAHQMEEARDEYVKAWKTIHYPGPQLELHSEQVVELIHGADTFRELKDYRLAKEFYAYALPMLEVDSIETGTDTSNVYASLAYCYQHLGPLQTPQAKTNFERAISLGEQHGNTNSVKHWLYVCCLADLLRHEADDGLAQRAQLQALDLYQQAREHFIALQGDESKYAALCNYYIGQLHQRMQDSKAACADYEAAAPVIKSVFGTRHPLYIDLLARYSNSLMNSGNLLKSLQTKAQLKSLIKS